MATNFVQPGEILALVAPYTRTSGQGALIGSIFGVATSDVASGSTGEFAVEGVWTLAKTSAQAWTQGQKVYWDDTNKRCDSDGTLGQLIGAATVAAANPSASGSVRLNEAVPSSAEGPETAVANVATADADATYGSPEAQLINELKAQVNLILAALRAAGILLP